LVRIFGKDSTIGKRLKKRLNLMDSSAIPGLTVREPDYPKGPGSSFRLVKKGFGLKSLGFQWASLRRITKWLPGRLGFSLLPGKSK
jgi:hypothetical protein